MLQNLYLEKIIEVVEIIFNVNILLLCFLRDQSLLLPRPNGAEATELGLMTPSLLDTDRINAVEAIMHQTYPQHTPPDTGYHSSHLHQTSLFG